MSSIKLANQPVKAMPLKEEEIKEAPKTKIFDTSKIKVVKKNTFH
jgi:hypothetical protein